MAKKALKVAEEQCCDCAPDLIVYAPGAKVALFEQLIPATVLEVSIRGCIALTYLATWFDQNGRNEVWVDAFEIHAVDEPKQMGIGFIPSEKKQP